MTTEELLIHELARRAGISIRTIRYYIAEGLLPPPSYQGKYSHYNEKYLERLELIRRLKESYLPLREIREIMNSLSDDQVKERLKQPSPPSPRYSPEQMSIRSEAKPGSKALEYINQVMDTQAQYRMKGSLNQAHPGVSPSRAMSTPIDFNAAEPAPIKEENETWQRLTLAPGVELNLRKPMEANMERRVQQLINLAKRIFHFES
jgi:DNA-binding transcriptional MerR regulator